MSRRREEYEDRVGRKNSKRRRSDLIDDKEDYESDEEYGGGIGSGGGGGGKMRRNAAANFFEEEAAVDSDEEEEEEEEGEDNFIDTGAELRDEDERQMHRRQFLPREDEHEDVEEIERRIQERYSKSMDVEYDDDEATGVEQQALLPSVKDTKLWMVKCAIGREREVAVRLMQTSLDKKPKLQITSVIALDYLEQYIYVEAHKESHVKEAVNGLQNITYPMNIKLVPIKEMTDVLTAESKAIDISRDTWVRMKIPYKGDLAKVVNVDKVRQRATVKLIPRIDLQALASKLEGNEITKKKAFSPPARLLNIDEVRELHIRVERKRDQSTGENYEKIGGMLFKDGFLYKNVSLRSLSTVGVHPTFDELQKFMQPGQTGEGDMSSLSTLLTNRTKGCFTKGDKVIVIKGELRNLTGVVEKLDKDIVHIKSEGFPETLVISNKELCKYFEPGNHVKVVSGATEGATGMVFSVEGQVVNILSDTTNEHLRVFADNVVEISKVTSGISRIGNYEGIASASRSNHHGILPRASQSPMRSARRGPVSSGGRRGGGRGRDPLVGAPINIRRGPFKGCKGRVIEVSELKVRVELEAQMKFVHVDRSAIQDNVNVSTPYRDTSRYSIGSETLLPPSQTPLHRCTTPMRDSGATPILDGMRTPMRDRAWNPYAPMSPPRDNWEEGNPGSWGTSPHYRPGSPSSRSYEAPTPGSGWTNTPSSIRDDAGTPRVSGYAYANAPSPSYLPGTPGGQPITPGSDGLDMTSPVLGADNEVPWFLPSILVNVRRSGEDSIVGVIKEVLPDLLCRVGIGPSEKITSALANEIEVVRPRKDDKIKIMVGAHRGATGKLIGIDGTAGIVKLDDTLDVKVLDMAILAKLVSA